MSGVTQRHSCSSLRKGRRCMIRRRSLQKNKRDMSGAARCLSVQSSFPHKMALSFGPRALPCSPLFLPSRGPIMLAHAHSLSLSFSLLVHTPSCPPCTLSVCLGSRGRPSARILTELSLALPLLLPLYTLCPQPAPFSSFPGSDSHP